MHNIYKGNSTLITKQEASEVTRLSEHTLKTYRRDGKLVELVHYIKINSRTIRYKQEALLEWVNCGYSYEAQRRLIGERESILRQKKKRGDKKENSPFTV
ncbi:MAG: helix-turn-helix transcriptional regulator [Xenococcus sp. (in: cyanobacteria)]